MKFTEAELKALAKQLRCPDGKEGLQVAEMMNVSNANIISKTIESLNVRQGEVILEIGPGNGLHIEDIISVGSINYNAVDISPEMVEVCSTRFQGNENVSISLTDGRTLPFPDCLFDKIFTVNTIYFWENPQAYAAEIFRVIKQGAMLSIGYIPERVMQNIPFARYGFTFYSENTIRTLLEQTGFTIINELTETEFITGTTGQQIQRDFAIISAVKP